MQHGLPPLVGMFLGVAVAGSASAAEEVESQVTPVAQIQTWVTAWDQDEEKQADPAGYGDPELDPGFTIRRARVGLEGSHGPVHLRVQVGSDAPFDALSPDTPAVGLIAAELGAHKRGEDHALGLVAGLIKIPFSRDFLMASQDLVFQERAVGTAWLAPGYDAGALGDVRWKAFRLRTGLFNGNASSLGDNNGGVLGAVRAELARPNAGSTYQTWDPEGGSTWGVAASALVNSDVATQTVASCVDGLLRIDRLTVQLEGQWARLTPADTTRGAPAVLEPTTRVSALGQVSYYQPLAHGGVEFAARIAWFDDALHLEDNGGVAIAHIGGTWRDVFTGFDVGGGFIHRMELQGRSLPNDTAMLWLQARYPGKALR